MKIYCKNGEIVDSLNKYYETEHWENITRQYIESDLSQKCYNCKKESIPGKFIHRTKKRLGCEKLTDILLLCNDCIDSLPDKSKKKTERMQLSRMGFNERYLSESKKHKILNIKPHLRGYVLSKYFSKKASMYNPSTRWINQQVKKTCNWIRRNEKVMFNNIENM